MSKGKNAGIFSERTVPFIRLETGHEFVAHWTGGPCEPNAKLIKVGRSNLEAVVGLFYKGFVFPVQEQLNGLFKLINGDQNEKNDRSIFTAFLSSAKRAMRWAMKIRPFMHLYRELPTNRLYTRTIHPVEELYMRCLIVTVMFGNHQEKTEALRLLRYDFVHMGGIKKDGSPEDVFVNFLTWFRYCLDLFEEGKAHPAAYRAFGDIVESVSCRVKVHYPKVRAEFARQVISITKATNCGFGRTDITSPAKTELLGRLDAVVKSLQAA